MTLTDSNSNPVVVSVASSGVFVQGSTGSATFVPNPVTPSPIVLATLSGNLIFYTPGATTVVLLSSQTITEGAPPITLAGTNNVAVLGSGGLMVQYPAGVVSYFTFPTPIPSAVPVIIPAAVGGLGSSIVGNLDNIPVVALPGGSAVLVGTQTVSMGGPAIVLSDSAVVAWATGGLVIQRPGGIVSTMALTQLATLSSSSTPPISTISTGVAAIIASSKFFSLFPQNRLNHFHSCWDLTTIGSSFHIIDYEHNDWFRTE